VVEEAVASGIETVVIVTSEGKVSLEDHFGDSPRLEQWLEAAGKTETLETVRAISEMAEFVFVRQKGPYGNGTPVLNAAPVIGKEPFAVIWADDLVTAARPRLRQLMDVYDRYESMVLTALPVTAEDTHKYGIIEGEEIEPGVLHVSRIVEKPGPERAPSQVASLGGYILTPAIFDALRTAEPGKDNELWLVDAIFAVSRNVPLYACLINGTYYDVGSKLGWLKANVELGARHPVLGEEFREYLTRYTAAAATRAGVHH